MKIETEGRIIEVIQKPYEVSGNKGISYAVRALIGDEIFKLKSSEEQTNELKKSEGQEGEFVLNLTSPKESLRITLAEFSPFQ